MNKFIRTSSVLVKGKGQLRLFSGGISVHRNTEDNTEEHAFDFTAKNYERVNTILAKVIVVTHTSMFSCNTSTLQITNSLLVFRYQIWLKGKMATFLVQLQ